ncbi:MAG: carboxypeptidase-like regulatory domain-containing protein [Pirellulales bacterium]|nr:carboxypeptidase-like regulatory domain-containing protein [Pirellulales bacterium]
MLAGYVSDEYYAALADVTAEFTGSWGARAVVRSTPSGALWAELPPGRYEVTLAKDGFGSKRVEVELVEGRPWHFRLLADRLSGYAWPKWCRAGDAVEFRVHSVAPYKLGLVRLGLAREHVRNIGWYDNHGPRAAMQTLPDGHFVETGVRWDAGFGAVHHQSIVAPQRGGLHYFEARNRRGEYCSFPLVVAPARPTAPLAVLASTNTWNAYNRFGGRSNYILAARMLDRPIVNAKSDLPRYKLADYGEWQGDTYAPLSFDRPEPDNQIREGEQATDPIEGRMECALAPAEWRTLAWLEQAGYSYDLYADAQLDDGTLRLDDYRALLLNVHPEYWTIRMYEAVKRWVFERGGRLLYLAGNGLNCAVELDAGAAMTCLNRWDPGTESRMACQHESEARLLGVVYTDPGAMTVAPYESVASNHWVFAGTGLRRGDRFGERTLHERYGDGASGHETDKLSASSPRDAVLLARGLNPDDGGAHMVYFDTPCGGAVFSAGSITYPTALLCDRHVARITANVLDRFLASAAGTT